MDELVSNGKSNRMAEPAEAGSFDNSHLYLLIKSLESKVNNMVREVNLLKNDLSKRSKKMNDEMKHASEEMLELKREKEELAQKMDLMVKELKRTAGAEEVEVLRKYLEYWNPMHFATMKDVERAIEAKMGERRASLQDKAIVSGRQEEESRPKPRLVEAKGEKKGGR
jgi:predicted transcriptional regulator